MIILSLEKTKTLLPFDGYFSKFKKKNKAEIQLRVAKLVIVYVLMAMLSFMLCLILADCFFDICDDDYNKYCN